LTLRGPQHQVPFHCLVDRTPDLDERQNLRLEPKEGGRAVVDGPTRRLDVAPLMAGFPARSGSGATANPIVVHCPRPASNICNGPPTIDHAEAEMFA
jgi:hypothetical protein